jgi:hypothetical protein
MSCMKLFLNFYVNFNMNTAVFSTNKTDQQNIFICQWFAVDWWISPGTKFSSTNKTDCHDSDIVEILLKVALKTIAITQSLYILYHDHDTPIDIYMYCCSTLRIEMRNTLTWLERFIWPWREIFSLGYVRSFLYLILIRRIWIIYSLFCQWFAVDWWISPCTKFSSTNKTDCHDSDIVERVWIIYSLYNVLVLSH